MGVGAGLYMCDVVKKKFTFAISSPDEFLSDASDRFDNQLGEPDIRRLEKVYDVRHITRFSSKTLQERRTVYTKGE